MGSAVGTPVGLALNVSWRTVRSRLNGDSQSNRSCVERTDLAMLLKSKLFTSSREALAPTVDSVQHIAERIPSRAHLTRENRNELRHLMERQLLYWKQGVCLP